MYDSNQTVLDSMVGKTFSKVEYDESEEQIKFHLPDGTYFLMYHYQDCCESVVVDDINGDLHDLVGTPILVADERNSEEHQKILTMLGQWKESEYPEESETWTFYTIRTIKGSVDIRWHGTSNGYYSESVDVIFFDPTKNATW